MLPSKRGLVTQPAQVAVMTMAAAAIQAERKPEEVPMQEIETLSELAVDAALPPHVVVQQGRFWSTPLLPTTPEFRHPL